MADNLAVRILIDAKDNASAVFDQVNSAWGAFATSIASGAALGVAVNEAAAFEQAMANVGAVANASAADLAAMGDVARELGATTAFSASEAAEGMRFLAMAGFEAAEAIAAIPGVLDLAAAGATDLGTAADIASNILSGMGLEAEEMGRVADVLAGAFTSSNTSIESLGETMKYVAPIAAQAGVSLEDLAAMAGKLGDAGIQGSEAGTALRASLIRLSAPTAEAAELMNQLGVETLDSAGNIRPAIDVLADLERSLEGMGSGKKIDAASVIFGVEAASAGLVLTAQAASGALDEMSASLEHQGRAAEIAQQQNDTFLGAMKTLGSAFSELQIAFAEPLLDPLTEQVREIAAALVDLAASPALTGLSDAFVLAFEIAGAAITVLIDALALLGTAITPIVEAVSGLIAVLQAIPSPIYAALSVFSLLLISVAALSANFATLTAAAASAATGLGLVAIAAAQQLVAGLTAAMAAVRALWAAMLANPITALVAVIGAATAGLLAYNAASEQSIQALQEQRNAITEQQAAIERLIATLDSAVVGSDEYAKASAELISLVPDLTVDFDEQGRAVVRLGDGYENNTEKLMAYNEELAKQNAQAAAQQLAQLWEQRERDSEALEKQTNFMREQYGWGEKNRTGTQELTRAIAQMGNAYDTNAQKQTEYANKLRESDAALRALAGQAISAGVSIEEMTTQLQLIGARDETISGVVAAMQELGAVSQSAGTDAQNLSADYLRIGEAGRSAGESIRAVMQDVEGQINQVNQRIGEQRSAIDTLFAAEQAGYETLREHVNAHYAERTRWIDEELQARLRAIEEARLSETEAAAATREAQEQAAAERLRILKAAQNDTIALIEQESQRRREIAERSGQDLERIEQEIRRFKSDQLSAYADEYRRHIDTLNAEAQRHLDEVIRIEQEIERARMSAEERLRELRRDAMTDEQAAADRRRELAETSAQYEQALAEGNLEQAEQLNQRRIQLAEQVYSEEIRARDEAQRDYEQYGNEIQRISEEIARVRRESTQETADADREQISALKQQIRELEDAQSSAKNAITDANLEIRNSYGDVKEAIEGQIPILEQQKSTAQAAFDSASSSADTFESALGEIEKQLSRLNNDIENIDKIELAIDASAVNTALDDLEASIKEKNWLVELLVDLDTLAEQLEEAQNLAKDSPLELELLLDEAESRLKEFRDYIGGTLDEELKKELQMSVDAALAEVGKVKSALHELDQFKTSSEHTVKTNAAQAKQEVASAHQSMSSHNTSSTHTIYVNKVETNNAGGLVGEPLRFASGGSVPGFPLLRGTTVPGSGNTDTHRAALPAGSFVLRKAASLKFRDLIDSLVGRFATGGLVPTLLTPGERVIPPHIVSRFGAGLFERLNALDTRAVQAFASGGLVMRPALPVGGAAETSGDVTINLRVNDRPVARVRGSREEANALARALNDLTRGL